MWSLIAIALAADPATGASSPAAGAAAVALALSARHDPPPCATLEAKLAAPAVVWRALADDPEALPWVQVRAARCLMAHPEPAEAALAAWLADPSAMGLVTASLPLVHTLPHVGALVTAGLEGPHGDLLRRKLSDDPILAAAVARAAP